jgi:hypothetical protein
MRHPLVLVDHDAFRQVPLAERAGKIVYDTRHLAGSAQGWGRGQ